MFVAAFGVRGVPGIGVNTAGVFGGDDIVWGKAVEGLVQCMVDLRDLWMCNESL